MPRTGPQDRGHGLVRVSAGVSARVIEGALGGSGHVPSSVVPNANEETSALSQAQDRAVSELLRVAPVADDLARRFQEAGFSLALVGGSVRDALLGRLAELPAGTAAPAADLLADLRRAIGSEQLFLHYQPKIRVATQKVAGAEALIRWHHPEHGLIPPDRFIRLAERSGAINEIGRWALDQACLQLRRWHDAGHEGWSMSVNLSPVQFSSPHLLQDVRAVIERHNIAPRHLVLEITESTVMRDTDTSLRLLQALSAKLGIVTGRDLAQACRDHYPKPVAIALWFLCEVAIVACDLAEVIGTAIALQLLFGIPLLWGVVLTALGRAAPPEKRSMAMGLASAGGSLGQVALADAGAFDDPLVGRVEHPGEVVVGEHLVGDRGADTGDLGEGTGNHACAAVGRSANSAAMCSLSPARAAWRATRIAFLIAFGVEAETQRSAGRPRRRRSSRSRPRHGGNPLGAVRVHA